MMWWGNGFNWVWMIFGGLMMVVFWGGLIALVFLGIRAFSGNRRWAADTGTGAAGHRTALDILKERYAHGEISREEYEATRRDLET